MNEDDVRKIIRDETRKSLFNVANVSWHTHNGIESPRIDSRNLSNSFFVTSTKTTGASLATVFNQYNAPINPTITGIFLVSQDTAPGNVSVYNSGRTVATIAKGTVAGTLVGATTLSFTTGATAITLASYSGATLLSGGTAAVFITFST